MVYNNNNKKNLVDSHVIECDEILRIIRNGKICSITYQTNSHKIWVFAWLVKRKKKKSFFFCYKFFISKICCRFIIDIYIYEMFFFLCIFIRASLLIFFHLFTLYIFFLCVHSLILINMMMMMMILLRNKKKKWEFNARKNKNQNKSSLAIYSNKHLVMMFIGSGPRLQIN